MYIIPLIGHANTLYISLQRLRKYTIYQNYRVMMAAAGDNLLQTAIVCVISGHHIVSPYNQILWFIIILPDLQP